METDVLSGHTFCPISLNWKRSSKGDRFCLGPTHGIRTRKGAELRKREAFSSAAREERGAGGASRTRTSLIAHHLIEKAPSDGGLSFLGPSQRDSNPPGCGAEETRSVFQRSTRGAKRAVLGQNVRQNLDQAVHVGFLADKRRQETQRMSSGRVNHGASGQRAGNNIMRIARSVIQIAAEH